MTEERVVVALGCSVLCACVYGGISVWWHQTGLQEASPVKTRALKRGRSSLEPG